MSDVSQSIRNPAVGSGVLDYFLALSQNGKVQAEYIWIGGSGRDIRSKTKTLTSEVTSLKDLPEWNFDGSSTGQASGHDSEVWLIPVKYVPDPFRKSPNILVLCECLDAKTMKPLNSNRRANARRVFENPKVSKEETWWGIEQEYTMFEADGNTPLGWPKAGFPLPQGPYYCSVGARRAVGRSVVEAHYRACLYAEIDISGINAEVMLGQWEYQVGPCVGIDSGDQLWLSRYILERVSEMFGICVSFDAKPIKGDWNGAGAHTNYSTKSMRSLDPTHVSKFKKLGNTNTNECKDGAATTETTATADVTTTTRKVASKSSLGYSAIIEAIEKMRNRVGEHMAVYGKDNKDRLLGSHETAKYDEFSYGVANRGASVRIPRMTERDGCGYFEDRRPAANCDPYDVTAIIAETTLLT